MMTKATYSLPNAWEHAARRLELLEQVFDPSTIRRLETIGVTKGWQCLEPGAGRGSIARWLAQCVGSSGSVLATDIDTQLLTDLNEPNVEVRCHDLTTDTLPIGAFDLIHTRLVLLHLPTREHVLRRLIAALKPGGWLLIEEGDAFPALSTASPPFLQMWHSGIAAMRAFGGDLHWARDLPRDLQRLGLTDIHAEGEIPVAAGSSPLAEFSRLNIEQLRQPMLLTGLVTEDEIDAALVLLNDEQFWFFSIAMIASWGRKP